jgi:perosamine synthetase
MIDSQASRQSRPAAASLAGKPTTDANTASSSVAKQRIMPVSYWRVMAGGSAKDEDQFLAKISERLGAETRAFPVGRARIGIYLLVKLALREGRRKVLMSPFTIPDVVTMVILAGAEPIFYDFAPNSTSCDVEGLAALMNDQTACVLVTHYHVNEPHLRAIADLCRSHGALLFDDCAIAFGGSIDGHPIGTLTDASVFSFSSFKLLNFFWGGLITTRDPHLADRIRDIVSHWPRLGSRDYMRPARGCLTYDLASRPSLFGRVVFPAFRRRLRRQGDGGSLEHQRIETTDLNPTLTSRPSLAAFAEWVPKLNHIDAWLERRRRIAGIYRCWLGARMVSADTPTTLLAGACFVNFPILVPQGRSAAIIKAMMLAGYDLGRSLYPNAHRHPKFTAIEGKSDNVDDLVARSLYLPTHFGVSEAYAEEIARRLLAEIG